MDIVAKFGGLVGNLAARDPDAARKLLLFGWRAQLLRLRAAPDRRLSPSRQRCAVVAMDTITRAMRHPERAAAVSAFAPYEPLEAAGITPYSVEQMSCFIAGTKCEADFLEIAGRDGFSETMCAYHRVFLGTLAGGMVPAPRFAVYTNLACDGNMITFPYLGERLGIPTFCIEVPFERSEESVRYVADQIRQMTAFVGEVMGKPVEEEALMAAVARGKRAADGFRRFLLASPGRQLPCDMTTEMYEFMMNHVLMGTRDTERICCGLADEMERAPRSDALRLVWLHTMPFSQPAAIERLNFNGRVLIAACDLSADPMLIDVDPSRPYEAMARRMVYSCFNGPTEARITSALLLAHLVDAEGAVVFNHWGCKATLGASRAIKEALEANGLPCLLLDGDGVDSANRSDGQTATRLDAFLELLETRRAAGAARMPGEVGR